MPATTTDTDGAAYAPHDWWGEADADDQADRAGHDASRRDPNDPGLFRAHQIRKARFDPVCGWDYQYGKTTPLSDPELYIGEVAGMQRHARRHNPESGALNWGGGTWTRIPDGTLDELLADVELWAEMHNAACDAGNEIGAELLADLKELAERQKRQQHENGLTDTQILANVVNEARAQGAVE